MERKDTMTDKEKPMAATDADRKAFHDAMGATLDDEGCEMPVPRPRAETSTDESDEDESGW